MQLYITLQSYFIFFFLLEITFLLTPMANYLTVVLP